MKKINILIVDDYEGLSETLSFIFNKKGYFSTIAKDGIEAVEKVKNKFFDIIITDIRMPRMNGVEALREIKKISQDSIVFMMTAYGNADLLQESLKDGPYTILWKPLDIEETLSLIEEALK